jgi:lysyl-tRNA synthetase class II
MTTFAPIPLTRVRNDLCQKWREYLLDGYTVEVATPILHTRPDIAPVRQFTTMHPTTGELAYLRIAPTEYLKRLLAVGHERIFEFSINFRDDLPDETHLPEFTSLEVMARNATCGDMEHVAIDLCALAVEVAQRAHVPSALPLWVQQWEQHQVERIELADELNDHFGVTAIWLEQPAMLARLLGDLGEPVSPSATLPALLDQLVTAIAQRRSGAVLICGFPERLGGPAASHPSRLGFKQRSELFIDGLEVANMSSNLTDSQALRQWHEIGIQMKIDLGIATNCLDDELLTMLDGNLPSSAVIGVGVERMLQATLNLPDIRILRYY